MSAENVELNEEMNTFKKEDEGVEKTNNMPETNEELKEAVYAQMRKIHNEGMVVGFQTACHTALNKIYAFESSYGKKSTNDYKRCLKDLKKFFETGISRKVSAANATNTEENVEAATAQN